MIKLEITDTSTSTKGTPFYDAIISDGTFVLCDLEFCEGKDGLIRRVRLKNHIKFKLYLRADSLKEVLKNAKSLKKSLENLAKAKKTGRVEIEAGRDWMYWWTDLKLKKPVRFLEGDEEKLLRAISDSSLRLPASVRRVFRLTKLERALLRLTEARVRALRDKKSAVRADAAFELGVAGDKRALEPLIRALGDVDSEVREEAARALGELKDGRAVEPLIRALGDEDSKVRKAAAKALGELKDRRAVEPLWQALGDKNQSVCKAVAEALAELKAVEPLRALGDELENPSRWLPLLASEFVKAGEATDMFVEDKYPGGVMGAIIYDFRPTVFWVRLFNGKCEGVRTPDSTFLKGWGSLLPGEGLEFEERNFEYVARKFSKCGSLVSIRRPVPKTLLEAFQYVDQFEESAEKAAIHLPKPWGVVFDKRLLRRAKELESFPRRCSLPADEHVFRVETKAEEYGAETKETILVRLDERLRGGVVGTITYLMGPTVFWIRESKGKYEGLRISSTTFTSGFGEVYPGEGFEEYEKRDFEYVARKFSKCGSLLSIRCPVPRTLLEASIAVVQALESMWGTEKQASPPFPLPPFQWPWGVIFDKRLLRRAKELESFPWRRSLPAGKHVVRIESKFILGETNGMKTKM